MSAHVGVAVATMRLRALAGCVTRLQEAGAEQSCSPVEVLGVVRPTYSGPLCAPCSVRRTAEETPQ